MSFSVDIKKELIKCTIEARHCAIAELAAIISICGSMSEDFFIYSENNLVLDRCLQLIDTIFQKKVKVLKDKEFYLKPDSKDTINKIYQTLKLVKEKDRIGRKQLIADNLIIQNTCCKRSFIRGAFLASGSVSDPIKAYHFEIVFQVKNAAEQLKDIMKSFNIEAKIIERGRYFVLYIKEGSQIVDILNVMRAHVALMELENVRIIKEMRNSINRQVNCETANLNKTVVAAAKQAEDIKLIDDNIGLGNLSEGLEEIAKLRISFPDATLKELGDMLSVPIGKSGVNHRLKKLCSIAESLKNKNKIKEDE